jgi:hypothetical protein
VPISTESPNASVSSILLIIKDEAAALEASFEIERQTKKNISEEIRVLARLAGRKFRLTLSWVRDDSILQSGLMAGHGYIEKEWQLRLKSDGKVVSPPEPPFHWRIYATAENPAFALGSILDESLLLTLIREKLVSQQRP